jgi:tetratricopeptide (TPR) repeat protein
MQSVVFCENIFLLLYGFSSNRGLGMFGNALVRGFIGISASLELALPCFSLSLSDVDSAYATRQPNFENVALTKAKNTVFDGKAIVARGGGGSKGPTPTLKVIDYSNTNSANAKAGSSFANTEPLSEGDIKQRNEDTKEADALYQSGLKYEKKGDLKNAQNSYNEALTLRDNWYTKNDPGINNLTNRLGEIALKQNDWEYADKCFKELMKSHKVVHGPGGYGEVPILLNLAQVEAGRGAIPAQIDYLDRALALQERNKGPEAQECLATRISLLDASINRGNWLDGEARLKQALDTETRKGNIQSKEYLHLLKAGSKIMTGLQKQSDAADYDRRATELQAQLEKSATKAKAETGSTQKPAATSKGKPVGSANAHKTPAKPSPKKSHSPTAAKN